MDLCLLAKWNQSTERSYKLLPKARLDLENIFRYISIELVNPESAFQLIIRFQEKFYDICKFAKAYSLLETSGLNDNRLRKTIVDNFVIVYLFDEKKDIINIVRVIYAKKDYIKELQ